MAFDLGAGLSAEQHQLQRAGVGDIGREIQKVLASPPRADRPTELVLLPEEDHGERDRQRELEQAAAQDHDELAEEAEQDVAGFVEDQVGQVEDRRGGRIHWLTRERPRPQREPDQRRRPQDGSHADTIHSAMSQPVLPLRSGGWQLIAENLCADSVT